MTTLIMYSTASNIVNLIPNWKSLQSITLRKEASASASLKNS